MARKTNDSFFKETPIGNVYGGYMKNYPLSLGGDISNAYFGVNDLAAVANRYNFPGKNPEYYAGINWGTNAPGEFRLPDYYGEMSTPLGKITAGTNDGNPNVNVGFLPNDKTSAYMNAIAKALFGGR